MGDESEYKEESAEKLNDIKDRKSFHVINVKLFFCLFLAPVHNLHFKNI